jgi:hypothetical protein
MNKLILALFFLCTLNACNNATKKVENTVIVEKEVASFFPVTNYIKGQIAELKSTGINPIKINTNGNKIDSVWLKVEDFSDAFKEFVQPVIDSNNLIQFFDESNFADQTLDAYTFTYTPKAKLPDSISLLKWDVHISPASNTVKRIFMVKRLPSNKELQLTWQSSKWCKTVCIATDNKGKQFVEYEQTIKWNFD